MKLYFAGLEKFSLIDFPGHLSAVGFTYGCNMRCPYCHNPELVTEKLETSRITSASDVLKFLESRIDKLDGFVVTGGEPTMHTGLVEFLTSVKDMGFKTKIDTNGSNPVVIQELLDSELVDYWAVDVKYGNELYKQGFNGGVKIADISRSLALIKLGAKDYEFRTTVTRGIHDEKAMLEIGELISGAKRYFIQNFVAGKTIDPTLDKSSSFTIQELKGFKKLMKNFAGEIEIRNV